MLTQNIVYKRNNIFFVLGIPVLMVITFGKSVIYSTQVLKQANIEMG